MTSDQERGHAKKQQEEIEKIASEKSKLLEKLKGMEKKLLRGERKGGMQAMASSKEQKLQRRQERLARKQ